MQKIDLSGLDAGAQARTAAARSRTYGLLARAFAAEPTTGFLDELEQLEAEGALAASGVHFGGDVLDRPRAAVIEALAIEYARLFVGPGLHVSPYASVHMPRGDGLLMGEAAVGIGEFMEAVGCYLADNYRGLPDHVSVVLEVMARLAETEAEAWRTDDPDLAAEMLVLEKRFLDENLRPFAPAFCARVIEAADLSFYRELAAFTADFLDFEDDEIAATLRLVDPMVAVAGPRQPRTPPAPTLH